MNGDDQLVVAAAVSVISPSTMSSAMM
jgi:hypothetical protein